MNPERKVLQLSRWQLHLPTFLPDATLGVVRSVDSLDLENCGILGLVMNTFHLMQRPGSSTVKALGKLHKMSGWNRPIVTDSGGFQAYSLIRENPKYGHLSDKGITFSPEGSARKFQLTPEKTIQLQLSYGTNVAICLDDCTHPDDSLEIQHLSVERTIDWAARCKESFEVINDQRSLSDENRPLIFGVIQGGNSRELRKRCADELLEIGFDGFGFGGWPLDSERNLLVDIIGYTRELVPAQMPMHALGVGHPLNVVEVFKLGYDLFDSALPTRDARRGRLYTLEEGRPSFPDKWEEDWFSYLYINDKKHIKAPEPIMPSCDCHCCANYSVGYLHHLFKIKDSLFLRLATIHNLRFMVQLTEQLGASRISGAKALPGSD
jgi:queuine tRNA-ribosyltransferase